jgi:hypothetical protein
MCPTPDTLLGEPVRLPALLVGVDLDEAALLKHRDELGHLGVGGARAGVHGRRLAVRAFLRRVARLASVATRSPAEVRPPPSSPTATVNGGRR